jgi:hypothetical protein
MSCWKFTSHENARSISASAWRGMPAASALAIREPSMSPDARSTRRSTSWTSSSAM